MFLLAQWCHCCLSHQSHGGHNHSHHHGQGHVHEHRHSHRHGHAHAVHAEGFLEENDPVLKGLLALGGIYVLFIIEHCIRMYKHYNKQKVGAEIVQNAFPKATLRVLRNCVCSVNKCCCCCSGFCLVMGGILSKRSCFSQQGNLGKQCRNLTEEAASKASWVFLQKQEKALCKKDLLIEPAIVRQLTRNLAVCSYLKMPVKQR